MRYLFAGALLSTALAVGLVCSKVDCALPFANQQLVATWSHRLENWRLLLVWGRLGMTLEGKGE